VTAVLGEPRAVLPHSRTGAHQCHRRIPGVRNSDLERRLPRRRLDQNQPGSGLFAGAAARRGQRQGHPAAARHPGQDRRGAARIAA
jgi:hypothetical protein